MTLFAVALIAGMLTVLAPCVLPLLPVILGVTATARLKWTPLIVVASLSASILVFTFLLKVSTLFISVPQILWSYVSGSIIALVGLTLLFPSFARVLTFEEKSSVAERALQKGARARTYAGDVLVGVALGPVFASCSPTFFFILATIIPTSFLAGMSAALAYVLGLALMLFLIALLGERVIGRLRGYADPSGWIRRSVGALFILLGILIAFGIEKKIEAHLLEHATFDVTRIEYWLLSLLP
jgi:cytochrome c-type biogenesis protein